MSEYTKVEFVAMEATETQYAQILGGFQATVDQLMSQLGTNLAEWTGLAQQAYNQTQAEWTQVKMQIQETFAALGKVIGTANFNYQAVEKANMQAWS